MSTQALRVHQSKQAGLCNSGHSPCQPVPRNLNLLMGIINFLWRESKIGNNNEPEPDPVNRFCQILHL